MRIDPVLRALAKDPAPQHAAQVQIQQALASWRAGPASGLFDELATYGAGAAFEACRKLAALFADPERAQALADSLVRAFTPVLAAEPFARVPFRRSGQGASANLLLGKSGGAILSLATREPGAAEPEVVGFADGERRDLVLAGSGAGTIVRRDASGFAREVVALAPGTRLTLATARETLLITDVRQGLVSLSLTRLAETPQPSREFRLSDGALLGQAAGDPRASRHELMLGVLGRMRRTDAAPVLAQMVREGSEHLRWQALRECLALDTATGYHALCAVARDPADPLASQAGALRAQLLEAHPQLARIEEQPCPA
jgi:hypothetical protein